MSQRFKLIIPLLDKKLVIHDIDPKSGFIDAFSNDINRPYLDNHFFLLYKKDINTADEFVRSKKFESIESITGKYDITIKGIQYTLYAFARINPAINKIASGSDILADTDKLQIYKFWNFEDEDINKHMLNASYYSAFEYLKKTLPEQDYIQQKARSR